MDKEMDPVTDKDIEAIISENEAGIADLMAAYEPLEAQYFSAVTSGKLPPTYSTTTNVPR